MATIGQKLLNPESGWKRFDNPNSMLTYTGAWTQGNYDGWYNTTSTYTSAVDASVKFNFIGTKLRILGYRSSNRSDNILVSIDGINYTFSCNTESASSYCSLVYEITGLPLREHYVSIINKDPRVFNFDAIDLDETGTLKKYNSDIQVGIDRPTNLIATVGNDQVTLSWSVVAGATGYNIKRSMTMGGAYENIANNVSTNAYTDTNVLNGTIYYYVVTALSAEDESANSNEISAMPIISAPSNLTAVAGDLQIILSWNTIVNASGYNVKRSNVAGGPYTLIANTNAITYSDHAVINGVTYYYVITAIDGPSESVNSNEVSTTPVAEPISSEQAFLKVTMVDSSEREYQLSIIEIDGFVNWFNNHTSNDSASYMLNKNMGLRNSKEYLAFDKIISFEVTLIAE